MFSVEEPCPEENMCLKRRTYLTGFGEIKDTVPILEDITGGGILFNPEPAPDYIPVNKDFEEIHLKEKACLGIIETGRFEERNTENPRRHNAITVGREIIYFPYIHGNFSFNTLHGKYLWRDRCLSAKPDLDYIYQLRKSIFTSLHTFHRLSRTLRINRLMLNDCLYCIGWFSTTERHRFINIIARSLRDQNEVTWLSAENTRLLQEDGLKLLFAIAVTAGFSLETLHLWHFFAPGQMPIIPISERTLHDPFIRPRPQDVPVDTLIRYLWREFILKSTFAIHYNVKTLILNTALQCLENLVVLSIEYSMLTGGQGNSLVQLGCINNSALRYLNILYTWNDIPQKTQRYICARAWKEACKKNPHFRVNLVSVRIADYELLSQILTPYIPMEGFFASSGIRAENESVWLGSTIKVLTERYKRHLKRITLHLCRPRIMVDFVITKILMQFPFLEEFVYRGPIDRLTSLHAIFQYVLKYELRLRKIHFYLHEDPCIPEPYHSVLADVHAQYQSKFLNKHIDFELKLCKM